MLALQAEIAQLRQDLLNAQMNNIKASSEGLGSEQTNEALDIFQKELNIASSQIVDTATDSISTT